MQALQSIEKGDNEYRVSINSNFTDENVKGNATKFDSRDERAVYYPNLVDFSYSAVAKVCETDNATVEHMYQEFLIQLKNEVKSGSNVRLAMKIGQLHFKNGEINWIQRSNSE